MSSGILYLMYPLNGNRAEMGGRLALSKTKDENGASPFITDGEFTINSAHLLQSVPRGGALGSVQPGGHYGGGRGDAKIEP